MTNGTIADPDALLAALDFSDTGLWTWDLRSGGVTWTKACYRITGRLDDGAALTGDDFFGLIHPDDRATVQARIDAALGAGAEFHLEFRIRRADDGAVRWIVNRGRARHGDDGAPLQLVGSVRDVTDEKRAEQGLRDSQERLHLAVEASRIGLWTWDLATDAVTWSPESYRIHGMAESEFDLTGAGFFTLVHPEDRARVEATVQAAVAAGEPYSCEFRIVRPGGDVAWVTNRGRARYGADGQPASMLGTIMDISERRLAEQSLQAALEAGRAGTFRWDIRSGGLTWDAALDRLFGLRPGEVVQSLPQFVALVHPDDRQGVIAACGRCRDSGADFEMEFRVVWPDGSVHWLYDRGRTLRDADGRPAWMTGACVDIDERKAIDDALRESERFHRQVIESIPGMSFTTTADGKVDYLSEHWERFLGRPRAALLHEAWIEWLHPDDRPGVLDAWRQSLAGGSPYDVEYRLLREDGEHVWFKARTCGLRDAEGRVVRWIGTSVNVHDLKLAQAAAREAQQRLARAQHAGGIGTWELDLATGASIWTEETARLYGLDPVDLAAVPLAAMRACVLPADVAESDAALARALAGERFHCAYRVRHGDGALRWLEGDGDVERDDHGAPVRIVGTVRDVTDQRAAEEALMEADRLKDQFLATLAHELRNPLAPLRTGLEVLRHATLPTSEARDARAMMERQLRHMVRLVDDLLDVSRISRGQIELRTTRVTVAAILADAVETSRPLMASRGQAFEVDPGDETLWVEGDLTRLAQVVANLLNNAAKYTPAGGRIWLVARRDGDAVEIEVADTGLGIEPELQERVFELFVQVDRMREQAQGGLGIGLALVRKLVELHGGRIGVRSGGAGRGSTFTVRLPLAAGPGIASVAPSSPKEVPASSARRVLVVDDNRDAAEAMVLMLKLLGHEVAGAHDGGEALATARAFGPEIVFLDIGLPGLSGYDVARAFRADAQLAGARLVALTGWGSAEDKRRCLEAGFDLHLTKPVDWNAVEETLGAATWGAGTRGP